MRKPLFYPLCLFAVFFFVLFLASCGGEAPPQTPSPEPPPSEPTPTPEMPTPAPDCPVQINPTVTITPRPAIRTFDLPAVDFARAMGVGWNLGNTLDAYANGRANETAWGNPRATPELFQMIRDAGFTVVRIPVTWMGQIGDAADDFAIRETWLARVQEVVDYALDADLYVIINIHHDGNNHYDGGAWLSIEEYPDGLHPNWFRGDGPGVQLNQEEIRARFAAVWRQIAERFRDYDARLLFTGFNELRELENYGDPFRATSMQNLNALNQLFVDTVRATGGNNAQRYLVVGGYNTNASITLNPTLGFQMPEDTVENRLFLAIHFYDPWNFSLNTGNHNIIRWGDEIAAMRAPGVESWGNEAHVNATIRRLHDGFTAQGIPILLGEYGVHDKSDIDPVNREYRRYWLEYVTRAMVHEGGFVPVFWDNGNARPSGGERFALFDRRSNEPRYEDLIFAIARAPYEEARPLFGRQMFEETFARYTHEPGVRALFDAAVEAADRFRAEINPANLTAVEDTYRALYEAIWN